MFIAALCTTAKKNKNKNKKPKTQNIHQQKNG